MTTKGTHITRIKGNLNVGTTKPSNPVDGEMFLDTSNKKLYKYDESKSAWFGHDYTTTSTSTTSSSTSSTSTSTSTTSTSSSSTSTTSTSTTV